MDGDVVTAVADVLNRAADLIERDGWCQGFYYDGDRRCIAAAIDSAAEAPNHSPTEGTPPYEAREAVEAVVGENWTIWNDIKGRTQAEVVAALRAAAERAA